MYIWCYDLVTCDANAMFHTELENVQVQVNKN